MIFTRTLYTVAPSQPITLTTIERTGTVVWSENLTPPPEPPPEPPPTPVYGQTFADDILLPNVTPFGRVRQLLEAYLAAPPSIKPMILDVMVAVALSAPVYEVQYNDQTQKFTITVPPPANYVESHNWAGWPMWPFVSPYPPEEPVNGNPD